MTIRHPNLFFFTFTLHYIWGIGMKRSTLWIKRLEDQGHTTLKLDFRHHSQPLQLSRFSGFKISVVGEVFCESMSQITKRSFTKGSGKSVTYMADVCRDIYDKMRADLRLSKEEAQRIETSRAPKVNVTISFVGFRDNIVTYKGSGFI